MGILEMIDKEKTAGFKNLDFAVDRPFGSLQVKSVHKGMAYGKYNFFP
jgi:hypothetical protein